ncbi:hypothetical protein IW140_002963 [Coemansia sp. RSA 1813]|nr:hypothetical protein EV178_003832 [Coemansia sp. RSA 1646]KAJ1770609.1 hypothetical protein LPJ74_003058 [Coemansia sp. RSA 1843]KAJ2091393.1 hypothetical protein IW138_001852 [Coemansia sp. RSA 986]KAJ2212850.1 hypothetical protein EV179_004337 [Coemansia sp. RSA 487]KAJ2569555.1 hypothetical protein IW140_002963 [Coemansia sp. RSA 1813]
MEGSWNTLRENLANEADVSPIDHANRTMMGLLMDRELDITRNIIMNGDSSYGRVTNTNKSALRRFNNLVLWPATDLYRYLNDFPLGDFKAMGIYPQDTINQKYECISVEEPGDELDSQRINLLYDGDKCDPNACDSNESNRNGEDGYTGKHDVSADVDPITDPTLNGGIGLVIKRVDDPNVITGTYCDDNVQILTRKHVMDPWLLAPRYCRVPLQDAVLKDDTINDSCAKQLIDMTRAQVLNQVLAHRARTSEPVSPEPLPLAKFVSSMVAEEAVGGISRTWSKMNEMLLNGVKSQSAPQPCPGTATTQWFSILEAALAADLPPEVVARSYRRLEKLCDIIPKGKSNGMASIATNSESYNQRKYPSRRLDNATDIPS